MYRPLVDRMPESASSGGGSAPGVCVCSWGSVCSWGRGVCSQGGVCSRGCVLLGGCSQGGVSQHALRQTPPLDRITDAYKKHYLGLTSLRPVISVVVSAFNEQHLGKTTRLNHDRQPCELNNNPFLLI